ncbi:signal transduction histidine kinase [Natranaerovirga hydrolytica]|uniref:histidine kinase n=1 Tax=Natranaerovirga hydrolytica TaxID=680378 RepID=A0A4R1MFS8_9FIRM|nr:HAMP domain-containing sensor histidine kinase [Natranaerovirga hydrolytica]TCK90590.1 signal transduction histidine kinase [Natranaerovirga hydrolytica]
MFLKLKNRFLILNIVIITLTMIFSFLIIFLITYNSIRSNIDFELQRLDGFNRSPNNFLAQPRPERLNDELPQERSVFFTLTLDPNNNIIEGYSTFQIDEIFLTTAKNIVINNNADSGSIKLDGHNWAYTIKSQFENEKIIFLDVTSQYDILRNLVYTFLVVALVMLLIIYFISHFFANQSIKPVKDAFEKQKLFISDASHELKTPLTVIRTNLDVVLDNPKDTIENQAKWLQYIKSEAERMSTLTNDLLYLSHIDSINNDFTFSSFNLTETLEQVLLAMEAIIFEKNIALHYELEENIYLYGIKEQIKQAAMIFIDNAIKYTNKHGKIIITLHHSPQPTLIFSNSGEGIPKEQLNNIFDRFYRVDPSRTKSQSGGYGLGLSIAKKIIEQHNGNITVESTPNELTTFTILFPIFSSKKHH